MDPVKCKISSGRALSGKLIFSQNPDSNQTHVMFLNIRSNLGTFMGLREATFFPFRIISFKTNALTTENSLSCLFPFHFSPFYLSELNTFPISHVAFSHF